MKPCALRQERGGRVMLDGLIWTLTRPKTAFLRRFRGIWGLILKKNRFFVDFGRFLYYNSTDGGGRRNMRF